MTPTTPRAIALATALAVAIAALAAPASAQELWRKHSANCDQTAFENPEGTELKEVAECTRRFFAYRDVKATTAEYRDLVIRAMKRLWLDGDDADAHEAKQALARLRVGDLPLRKPKTIENAVAEVEREPCDVPEPSKGEIKKAKKKLKAGLKHYKKEKYDKALASFLDAVEIAPGWSNARYNAAAMYGIQGEEEGMIEQLYCLRDIGDKAAIDYLRKARKDSDFAPIRDKSAQFKYLTGYARIQIANSLGEYGEENVDNLEATIEVLGWGVDDVTVTQKPYKAPHIWYKDEARTSAYFILKILKHPQVRVSKIDWDNEAYDIKIAWGDRIKAGEDPPVYIGDPEDPDAEAKLDDLLKQQDQALREPEKVVDDIDKTLDTPNRVADKVGDSVDRVGNTVDKVEKVGDTINKTGNTVKGLGGMF